MTGHNTSGHRLGTQGEAMATTWVLKTALFHGVWQVDFLHLVEGQGRGLLPLQFTSPTAHPYLEKLSHLSVGPLVTLRPSE